MDDSYQENLARFRHITTEVREERELARIRVAEMAEQRLVIFAPVRRAWDDLRAAGVRTVYDKDDGETRFLRASDSLWVEFEVNRYYTTRYWIDNDNVLRVTYTDSDGETKTDSYGDSADALIERMYRDIAEHQAPTD